MTSKKAQKMKIMIPKRAEGNIIIYSVALGMLIFTLGQGILRLQGAEARAAGKLYQSEQAHYAAESGVEISLLEIQKKPRNHVQGEVLALNEDESQVAEVTIKNRLPEFGFTLQPEQAKQLTLEYDLNDGLDFDPTTYDQLQFVTESEGGESFEINKCLGSPSNEIEQVPSGNSHTVNVNANVSTGINCVIQFKNLAPINPNEPSDRSIKFVFSGSAMSPHNTRITSIGKAGTREKHLTFSLERNKSLLNINFFQQ